MPMQETTYYILAALLDQPRHGYAIIKAAAQLSDERVKLATGTLYAALDRLTGAGLIEIDREEVVNGRARRHYRLTAAGGAELLKEAERLAAASRVVVERRPFAAEAKLA